MDKSLGINDCGSKVLSSAKNWKGDLGKERKEKENDERMLGKRTNYGVFQCFGGFSMQWKGRKVCRLRIAAEIYGRRRGFGIGEVGLVNWIGFIGSFWGLNLITCGCT